MRVDWRKPGNRPAVEGNTLTPSDSYRQSQSVTG